MVFCGAASCCVLAAFAEEAILEEGFWEAAVPASLPNPCFLHFLGGLQGLPCVLPASMSQSVCVYMQVLAVFLVWHLARPSPEIVGDLDR